ncbi:hypothetical protein A33M_3860 [Rhodovulum sp. PH10]|uniref:methyltransferase domain-containing protein n=1 Tax=Rhodovulum sp. PH10 TaxID=1187851 RepID=UPI00027C2727|nr:class I SAM-dependent methyltransferase [Rhodovulum sp. PH10]EJW13440.1 hypothetical protein A33M_3860 [Rhodovulum sp. PH10]
MTMFSAGWLQRREPHDRLARDPDVLKVVAETFRSDAAISVVDIACGTGAMMRAIHDVLPMHQHWRLVDNDLGLLARASAPADRDVRISPMPLDLDRDLEAALDGPVDLVVTSGFLDLVSERWLDRLVTELAVRNLPFYATLSYDGRVELEPWDEADRAMVSAFNRHQTLDKGFGGALGPEAAAQAVTLFRRLGYEVTIGPADWAVEASAAIHAELIAGLAGAARELVGIPETTIDAWESRRLAWLDDGLGLLRIGHTDFFARPTVRR